MATYKELGTKAFAAKDFMKAVEHFSAAIEENPKDHTLFANRSACYCNLHNGKRALEDAEASLAIKPDWDKGH